MLTLDRTNTSLIGRWWWTVDHWTLGMLVLLIVAGAMLVMTGSPAVANRIGVSEWHFVERHVGFMSIGVLVMLTASLLPVQRVHHLALLCLAVSLVLMLAVPFVGYETKGASRWIHFGSLSVQPSEFMKPCFAVVTAWLLAEKTRRPDFPGIRWSIALYAAALFLLVLQPDIGMVVTVSLVWISLLFFAGVRFYWFGLLGLLGVGGMILGYLFLPHVTQRVDNFINPDAEGNYQIERSLEAFRHGGMLGVGVGKGTVIRHLPDAHTDFIYAVAAEEMGVLGCLGILALIMGIIVRSVWRIWQERDLFVLLSTSGLLVLFGVQSLINIGVSLRLLPTKGMTLPLVSYGGSSTIAYALAMGMLLALTRRRYGQE